MIYYEKHGNVSKMVKEMFLTWSLTIRYEMQCWVQFRGALKVAWNGNTQVHL